MAGFWAEKMEESFRAIGYSFDWRRKFTLSITPQFSRFVEWQYNTLKKRGYIVQGTHPVVWCPHDQSPTGDHDRLEGEGESPVEYTLIKFPFGDAYLAAATLRPETVYGATNIWLNPHADYVKIEVDGEKWIIAKESVIKIKDQFKDVKQLKEYDEKIELFGKRARNPVTNIEIPILPSAFVDPGNATGVVMSVPAHAPYDYIALEEFKNKNEEERFGIEKEELEPISLVKTGLGETPARSVCEQLKITSTKQEKELDEATNILYKKEFHTGILNEKCGPYQGMSVSDAKEKIVIDFIEKEISDVFYDVNNVICRCTAKCHVKILENQWFLKYSDEGWKKLVRECLSSMKVYPEDARNNFMATIEWMKDKACARKSGLGTRLPWDKEWIVETLSDSTIYMAYYTIAHIVSKYKIHASKLTGEVFNYIFLGKGNPKQISKNSGLRLSLLQLMKPEFQYFYPIDFRNSAKDLVQNHLTFMMFHHVAIWPKDKWPRTVAVNGFVNVEGEKMSKSKGNIIPLKNLVDNYGADMTRINIAVSSEGMDDADWRAENLQGFRNRFDMLFDLCKNIKKSKRKTAENIDSYILSRVQRAIKNTTDSFEATKFRTANNNALFDVTNDLKWYLARCGSISKANRKILAEVLSTIIRLVAPFTPHVCEEMWSLMGNRNFVSVAEWPKYNAKLMDEDAEKSEDLIRSTLNDIREIQKLKKMKPTNVRIFVAEGWKFFIYSTILKDKNKPMNEITKEIMSGDMKKYGSATVSFIQNLYRKMNDIRPIIDKESQIQCLNDAKGFLESEIGSRIEIIDADKSQEQKARSSMPHKFGILLE